jgi:hypothetical protein
LLALGFIAPMPTPAADSIVLHGISATPLMDLNGRRKAGRSGR